MVDGFMVTVSETDGLPPNQTLLTRLSGECGMEVDFSLPDPRVSRVPVFWIWPGGLPKRIRVDKGRELSPQGWNDGVGNGG